MNLIKLNTNNLTELWTIAGMTAGIYYEHNDFSVSEVRNSAWPNKLWFHHVPTPIVLKTITERWNMNSITIPVWGTETYQIAQTLNKHGYIEYAELAGMSITLNKAFQPSNRLDINKVDSHEKAVIWSALFRQSFGYTINTETVVKTMDRIDYLIASFNETLVGTGLLYIDSHGIAGVHSMGIISDQRRKGYAEELLTHLLNTAQKAGAQLATLQASSMGEGLYLKTGFKKDFQLKYFKKL